MEQWWSPALQEVFGGRRVIIAGAVPQAWNEHVDHLTEAGASEILVVATGGEGIGPAPDVPTIVVEPPEGLSMMERLRFDVGTLGDPPDEVRARLDEFDPDRSAVVCGGFLNEAAHLDGRPLLAFRRPDWVALEDKTVVDDVWDRAGVDRRPSVVVELEAAPDAAARFDEGAGTVWAADARDGYHGGATGTRWVVDDEDSALALDDLRPMCDRVRIMPFVDGTPCSIHGLVSEDGIAVLRPVEMVTLRRDRSLVYSGAGTHWDPPDAVRETMRRAARRVATHLAESVDFRGAFTIDGVVREDGFWPTELNPRFGAGLNVISRATDDIPLLLLHDLLVAGRSIGLPIAEAESALVEHADAHRSSGTWRVLGAESVPSIDDRPATFDPSAGHWTWTDHDGQSDRVADGLVTAGSTFARCRFDVERTPVGPSIAARAAAFWRFAEPELGLDHSGGPLTPAPDPFA
ncbi:MAG: ATP-grasp domain-containing protein [Actinomycetota bacterium]